MRDRARCLSRTCPYLPIACQSRGSVAVPAVSLNDKNPPFPAGSSGADDGDRTRDPQLGKLMLYQLSYVRVALKIARR